jgi:hypothetical protein
MGRLGSSESGTVAIPAVKVGLCVSYTKLTWALAHL